MQFSRCFRLCAFGLFACLVLANPVSGWTAFFVELIYESPFEGPDEFDYHFTTEMRVLPEVLPFEADLNRDRMTVRRS